MDDTDNHVLTASRLEITTAADRASGLRRFRQGDREWTEERPRRQLALLPPTPGWLPEGWREIDIRAYTDGRQVVIPEQTGLELPDETDEETGHNCDVNGCGWEHIMGRFDLPEPKGPGTEAPDA